MDHTVGELKLIRSPKHPGDIFVRVKGQYKKFICKFYGGGGTDILPAEAEANVCRFVELWNSGIDTKGHDESKPDI